MLFRSKGTENLREVRARDAAVRDAVASRPACIRKELRPEHAVEDRKVDRKILVDGLGLGSVGHRSTAQRHGRDPRKMPVSPRTLRRRRATLNSPSDTDAIKTVCSTPR